MKAKARVADLRVMSDDQLEDTGYVEDGDGDDFRYLRTAGAGRRDRF